MEAGAVRNDVAMQAMKGQRPESDADECREAFRQRWESELLNTFTYEETYRGNFRGD